MTQAINGEEFLLLQDIPRAGEGAGGPRTCIGFLLHIEFHNDLVLFID